MRTYFLKTKLKNEHAVVGADYKELLKPLKKPPHGLEWRRLEDGAWELRRTRKAGKGR